ncbi:MAG: TRAP transporter substrate-binding protein [Chloroflexi bacterium]|nr:TRAP transporter substrate-binding protein [Chloroflexota bacterium]
MQRERKLTFGVVLLLLLAVSLLLPAACAQPASTPAPPAPKPTATPSPSPAATPKPSPAPSPSPTATPKPTPAAAPIVLRFSTYTSPTHIGTKLDQRYADTVKERTKGAIEIKMFPGQSLVAAAEELRALSQGTSDMAALVPSTIAGQVKDLGAESLPFIGIDNSRNAFMQYFEDALPLEEKAFAKFNVKRLMVGYTDYRQVFTSKKQVKTLADFKGMKLRVSGRWQEKLGEAKYWDFGAVSLPSAEQYMALQRGTVDGMITTAEAYIVAKLYEVASYATYMNQVFGAQRIAINLDAWKKIPPDLQKIMVDVGKESVQWTYENLLTATDENKKKAEGLGAKSYVLPEDEKAKWIASVQPLWDEYVKEVPEGKPWIDLFKKAMTIK